jgi:hypothetical protein
MLQKQFITLKFESDEQILKVQYFNIVVHIATHY